MFTLSIVLILHFLGDFVAQTRTMATNKSTSNKWLLSHVAVYSLFLLPIGLQFALINAILHFCVDYVTSRWTSRLWKDKNIHGFFMVIGFDQLLHVLCLIWTLSILA